MGLCEDWCQVDDVIECAGLNPEDETAVANAVRAVTLATGVLYWRTGNRWGGICTEMVRPCARRAGTRSHRWPGATADPDWWAWHPGWGRCGCSADVCGCAGLSEITLGRYPLAEDGPIIAVLIDGEELDPAAYRVDERRLLVRTDGQVWPFCQDLARDLTEADTFGVEIRYGDPPPPDGEAVAQLYACELVKAMGGQECNIPSRVVQIVQQGKTYSLANPAQFVKDGLTGVNPVDVWIVAANGGRVQPNTPMQVASPDVGRKVRRMGDPLGS